MQPIKLPEARKPRHQIVIPERVAQRAAERFLLDAATGCHISTYSTASHGYAQIGWHDSEGPRAMVTAHRAAWAYRYGQIPEGMTIDHTCKNRRCVNVEHLRLLTNFENARRTFGRDWPLGQCAQGHSNDLLARLPSGRFGCSQCYEESKRKSARVAREARRKAA